MTGNNTSSATVAGPIAFVTLALFARTITYTPNPNYNGPDTLTLVSTLNGRTDTDTVAITVTPVNDAPVNTLPPELETLEDTPQEIVDISIADVDAGSDTIDVTLSVISGTLSVPAPAGITIVTTPSANGVPFSIKLTGTLNAINAALTSGVTYTPTENFNGEDTLTMVTNDGSGANATDTSVIFVTAVNDPPVNTVPASPLSTPEDTQLRIEGLSVVDVDLEGRNIGITLTVARGTLSTNPNVIGSDELVLFGTLEQVNASLANVYYTPNPNFNGDDTLRMVSDDAGDLGVGLIDTDIVAITVTPVNDGPVNVLPDPLDNPLETLEDTPLLIHGISVSDIDAGNSSIEVTLSVNNGTLSIPESAGVELSLVSPSSIKLRGSAAAINAALFSGVTYMPNKDDNGEDTLTVVTDDRGNTGDGGAKTATNSVSIVVIAVPDAPIAENSTILGLENLPVTGTLDTRDPDGDEPTISIVTQPTTGTVTVKGTVFTYKPTVADFVGNTSFTFKAKDSTNRESQIATVTINVQATVAPIAGRVFFDVNGNGTSDPTEPGIANIEVTLSAVGADFIPRSTRTNEYGEFDFRGYFPRDDYLLSAAQPVFTSSSPGAPEDFQIAISLDDQRVSRDFSEKEVVGSELINTSIAELENNPLNQGLIFAHGSSDWWTFGDGWAGYKNLSMTVATDGLTIALSADRITKTNDVRVQKEISVVDNPSVVLERFAANQFIVNLRGSAEDFGLPKGSLPGWAVLGSKDDDVLTVDYSAKLFWLNNGAKKRLSGIETIYFDGGTGTGVNTVAIFGRDFLTNVVYKPDTVRSDQVPRNCAGTPLIEQGENPGEAELARSVDAFAGPGGGYGGGGGGGGGFGGGNFNLLGAAGAVVPVASPGANDFIILPASRCLGGPGLAAESEEVETLPIVDARNIQPVDFSQLGSLNVQLTGVGSQVLISDDFNTGSTVNQEAPGTVPAWKVSGTSGGGRFEQAHVYQSQSLIVDTSTFDGDDTVTFNAGNGALVNQFSVMTGPGSDAVVFDETVDFAALPFAVIDLGEGTNQLKFLASGNLIDLSSLAEGRLLGVSSIDLRGGTGNHLKLSPTVARAISNPSTTQLEILYNSDAVVEFVDGWQLAEPIIVDGKLFNVLESADRSIKLMAENNRPFRNPLLWGDVNRDGKESALDALNIINYMGKLAASAPPINGQFPLPSLEPGTFFRYLDPAGNGFVSAQGALVVINSIGRRANVTQPAGESVATSATFAREFVAAVVGSANRTEASRRAAR